MLSSTADAFSRSWVTAVRGGATDQSSILAPAATLCASAIIPILVKAAATWMAQNPFAYRIVWPGAFLINLIIVSLPGRFDSNPKEGVPWESLFEPAGWAFGIWPVIYLFEAVSAVYVAGGNEPVRELTSVAPFWLAAHLFQSAWCLAFCPQMKRALWVPALFLAGAAISLGMGHRTLTQSINHLSKEFNVDTQNVLKLIRIPFALHTGWLSAATLLNLNAWLSVSGLGQSAQVAVAFLSAYVAAAVGALLGLSTRDPTPTLTIAWALTALGARSQQKAAVDAGTGGSFAAVRGALALTEKAFASLLVALGINLAVPNPIF